MRPIQSTNRDKDSDVLIGWRDIARYCHVSPSAVMNWHKKHGLPIAKMPNRQRMTTKSLIEQWIWARYLHERERKFGIQVGGNTPVPVDNPVSEMCMEPSHLPSD